MLPLQIDLLGLNAKDLEWYQMFIRAFIVFIVAIAFIRIAGMRSFGTKSAFDVVLSITLGAILSRCITGHYPFFASLATAMFIALLHRLFAWFSFKSKLINKLLEGDPVQLFNDGKKIEKNLALHSIQEKELKQAVREENMDNFEKVKTIWFEPDGKISVVKKEE
jgi:uncharacterized membrane protein YcaP (DUF421 family)